MQVSYNGSYARPPLLRWGFDYPYLHNYLIIKKLHDCSFFSFSYICMKLKSISDIITNSSSEVFIMTIPEAKYWREIFMTKRLGEDFGSIPIDYNWVKDNLGREFGLICKIFGLDKELITDWVDNLWNEETQEIFLELSGNKILGSTLLGSTGLVTVSDEFFDDPDILMDIIREMRKTYDGPYYEYRH